MGYRRANSEKVIAFVRLRDIGIEVRGKIRVIARRESCFGGSQKAEVLRFP
jgi:hypothetical protein